MPPNGERGPSCHSRFPVPVLQPPTDTLIALLSAPPVGKLHQPMSMHLIIRNRHPTRSANIAVQLRPDPADAFVVSGMRQARMPILLPRTEERIYWNIVPVECGYVSLPRLTVANHRRRAGEEGEQEGELVKVVDVRWDNRGPASQGRMAGDGYSTDSSEEDAKVPPVSVAPYTVLILP